MKFSRATVATCAQATGTVVVIDVLRAFSTAAYAFAAGVNEIYLTREVGEAMALRDRLPGSLIAGEVGGLPVPGFDFSNSPSDLVNLDLRGRRLIQRTSAGTQGVVLSTRAQHLLATSFVCAGATARFIRGLDPQQLTFVITGDGPNRNGDEDAACADYLEALLYNQNPEIDPYLQRVRNSTSGRAFADPAQTELPAADLDYCMQLDRFNFAMQAHRENGLVILRRVQPM